MKRRITIDLDIDLNGVPEDYIDERLDNAVRHLAGDGWFTGPTSAEVDEWSYKIKDPMKVPEKNKASVSPLPSKQMKG